MSETTHATLTLADTPIRSIMVKHVITAESTRLLVDCLKIMKDADIGSLVILENDKPVGIFTERDLIRKISNRLDSLSSTVGHLMSRPLKTIAPSATVWDGLILMGRHGIRRLPVIEEGKLVGIVTERDIIQLIIAQQNLLLEAVSESLPASAREKLHGISGALGLVKPPSRIT